MLVHRLRRWPNIQPALGQHLVLAEISLGAVDIFSNLEYTQQTQDVESMLVYAGPTLNQHWVNVLSAGWYYRPFHR